MRTATLITFLFLTAGSALAAPPVYQEDPFGDDDFVDPPLILDTAHPTGGRFEVGLNWSGSTIDKYSSHMGLQLDLNYHFLDTLGVALSYGIYQGTLTNIVTSGRGIIGNKMSACIRDAARCSDINPNVPDYSQITNALDIYLIWSPLYGKINVVSELDVNLQIYALFGGGFNGTRRVTAIPQAGATLPTDYDLQNGGFFEGVFDQLAGNIVAGTGLRIFFTDWLNLRAEFRALIFFDDFDFDADPTTADEPYASIFYFTNIGLGFVLF